MASLDISPEIGRSYQSLISSPAPANKPSTYAQWAVFAVSAPLQNAFVTSSAPKASTLKVHSTGEGELGELIEEFNDGKVQFAFVKVKDPNSGLPKFVLIAWCGEGVPERVKGYFTGHLNATSKVLHGYHVQVTARSESDLSPETIVQKVGDASGAKYSSSSTSAVPAPSSKPVVPSSKPAYQPTRVSGATTSRAPYRRDGKTDTDGWGEDAPPVTRSQLEKVAPAYKPTKVDISALRAQPTSTTSGFGSSSAANDRPDIVKGAYQPIGKVDIAAIRAQAQQKSDRPEIVKGAYEPVGKVDIAAIRAQARPRSPVHQQEEERVKPVAERSAAFSQGERLTSLPKPKPAKKFGTGVGTFGTKPPTPGGFGLGPSVPAATPVGAASRDFGSSGGKTPAQLWAEKKARERGPSGASETTPPTISPGYTGQHYPPVSTSTTGRSSGSNDGLSNKFSQQKLDDHDEDIQVPTGGISALRNRFAGAPPMGTPTTPKSPTRTGGHQFQQTTGDHAPPPPAVDTSSRPSIVAGGAVAISGFPPRPAEDHEEIITTTAGIPPPPAQPPRSPTPPTPEIPGSPIRIAMPVARGDPITRHDPEPESSFPTESLSRVVPQERDLDDEEPVRDRSETVGVGAGGETVGGGSTGKRAVILFDYEATEENEINLIEGQVVGEVDMVDADWWAGRNAAGEHGLFPSNYVEIIEETEEEEQNRPLSRDRPAAENAGQSPEPQNLASSNEPSAVAQYDYEATEDNELTFPEDAIIEDIEFPDDDWWLGTYQGKRGLFPANYVVLRQ